MFFSYPPLKLATYILAAVSLSAPKAEEFVTAVEWTQFRPKGFTGRLMPYDLKKVFQVNNEKAQAGKPHNYSSFLVKEFSEHYYPKAEFQWHTAGSKFRNVGFRKSGKHKIQEVFLSWISLSDGLQWGWFNGEIERTTKADRFAIITDAEITKAIKSSLQKRNLIDEPNDVTDVFRYRARSFRTDQKSSQLTFPAKDFGETQYGVTVGDRNYFFTAQGKEVK